MRRLLVAILAVGMSGTALAATLGLHLGSAHYPSESYQNNFNPGVYVRTDDGLTAGAYYNTLRRTSIYAGYTLQHGPFGLMVGAVTGYKPKTIDGRSYGQGYAVTPMVALSLSLPKVAGVTPVVMLVPPFRNSPATLHIAVERRF